MKKIAQRLCLYIHACANVCVAFEINMRWVAGMKQENSVWRSPNPRGFVSKRIMDAQTV